MIKIVDNKIYLTRGDSAILKVEIRDTDGEEYTPEDTDTVIMTFKKTTSDKEPIFTHEIDGGILMIEPEDTADLAYGDYVYDCQLKTEAGFVQTFIPPSLFRVLDEVTR